MDGQTKDAHRHAWKATSKVFALRCDCGTIYHDWLEAELRGLGAVDMHQIDGLRAENADLRQRLTVLEQEKAEALAAATERATAANRG